MVMCVVVMISNFACTGGGVVHTRVVVGACVVKVQLGGVHGTVVVAPAIIIVIIVSTVINVIVTVIIGFGLVIIVIVMIIMTNFQTSLVLCSFY